jgi:Flp pilus assembly protein TadG
MRVIDLGRLRNDRGAVLPIVVICLVAFFGMVVLTVDVGGLMAKRRSMVNASDAAALAAAQSFALRKEAVCGSSEGGAQAQADQYATGNVAGATRLTGTAGFQTDCAAQTVKVAYQTNQQLFFAQVLGFSNSTPVGSTATAIWGPTKGGTVIPLELDPSLTNQCVYPDGVPGDSFNDPQQCPKAYWFDNGSLTNSGWGLMNLNTWNVSFNASCDNSGGANDLAGWINQTNPVSVSLTQIPTYVCITNGLKNTNWFNALAGWAGTDNTFLFPINDPAQMNYKNGSEKYAIIGFAPMQIVSVISSKDAAAVGTSATCTTSVTLAKNQSIDLSTAALTTVSGDCSGNPRRTISVQNVSGPSSDYTITPSATSDSVIFTANKAGTFQIRFSYWYGGACPGHEGSSNPNAYCLVLKWAGPKVIGVDSTGTGYGPAMAVRLVK